MKKFYFVQILILALVFFNKNIFSSAISRENKSFNELDAARKAKDLESRKIKEDYDRQERALLDAKEREQNEIAIRQRIEQTKMEDTEKRAALEEQAKKVKIATDQRIEEEKKLNDIQVKSEEKVKELKDLRQKSIEEESKIKIPIDEWIKLKEKLLGGYLFWGYGKYYEGEIFTGKRDSLQDFTEFLSKMPDDTIDKNIKNLKEVANLLVSLQGRHAEDKSPKINSLIQQMFDVLGKRVADLLQRTEKFDFNQLKTVLSDLFNLKTILKQRLNSSELISILGDKLFELLDKEDNFLEKLQNFLSLKVPDDFLAPTEFKNIIALKFQNKLIKKFNQDIAKSKDITPNLFKQIKLLRNNNILTQDTFNILKSKFSNKLVALIYDVKIVLQGDKLTVLGKDISLNEVLSEFFEKLDIPDWVDFQKLLLEPFINRMGKALVENAAGKISDKAFLNELSQFLQTVDLYSVEDEKKSNMLSASLKIANAVKERLPKVGEGKFTDFWNFYNGFDSVVKNLANKKELLKPFIEPMTEVVGREVKKIFQDIAELTLQELINNVKKLSDQGKSFYDQEKTVLKQYDYFMKQFTDVDTKNVLEQKKIFSERLKRLDDFEKEPRLWGNIIKLYQDYLGIEAGVSGINKFILPEDFLKYYDIRVDILSKKLKDEYKSLKQEDLNKIFSELVEIEKALTTPVVIDGIERPFESLMIDQEIGKKLKEKLLSKIMEILENQSLKSWAFSTENKKFYDDLKKIRESLGQGVVVSDFEKAFIQKLDLFFENVSKLQKTYLIKIYSNVDKFVESVLKYDMKDRTVLDDIDKAEKDINDFFQKTILPIENYRFYRGVYENKLNALKELFKVSDAMKKVGRDFLSAENLNAIFFAADRIVAFTGYIRENFPLTVQAMLLQGNFVKKFVDILNKKMIDEYTFVDLVKYIRDFNQGKKVPEKVAKFLKDADFINNLTVEGQGLETAASNLTDLERRVDQIEQFRVENENVKDRPIGIKDSNGEILLANRLNLNWMIWDDQKNALQTQYSNSAADSTGQTLISIIKLCEPPKLTEVSTRKDELRKKLKDLNIKETDFKNSTWLVENLKIEPDTLTDLYFTDPKFSWNDIKLNKLAQKLSELLNKTVSGEGLKKELTGYSKDWESFLEGEKIKDIDLKEPLSEESLVKVNLNRVLQMIVLYQKGIQTKGVVPRIDKRVVSDIARVLEVKRAENQKKFEKERDEINSALAQENKKQFNLPEDFWDLLTKIEKGEINLNEVSQEVRDYVKHLDTIKELTNKLVETVKKSLSVDPDFEARIRYSLDSGEFEYPELSEKAKKILAFLQLGISADPELRLKVEQMTIGERFKEFFKASWIAFKNSFWKTIFLVVRAFTKFRIHLSEFKLLKAIGVGSFAAIIKGLVSGSLFKGLVTGTVAGFLTYGAAWLIEPSDAKINEINNKIYELYPELDPLEKDKTQTSVSDQARKLEQEAKEKLKSMTKESVASLGEILKNPGLAAEDLAKKLGEQLATKSLAELRNMMAVQQAYSEDIQAILVKKRLEYYDALDEISGYGKIFEQLGDNPLDFNVRQAEQLADARLATGPVSAKNRLARAYWEVKRLEYELVKLTSLQAVAFEEVVKKVKIFEWKDIISDYFQYAKELFKKGPEVVEGKVFDNEIFGKIAEKGLDFVKEETAVLAEYKKQLEEKLKQAKDLPANVLNEPLANAIDERILATAQLYKYFTGLLIHRNLPEKV